MERLIEDGKERRNEHANRAATVRERFSTRRPVVLIAAPYIPFPLAHGGAVRMYNLMRRAAADYDQVLITFADELRTPPAELEICKEVVQVKRIGSHMRPSTARPDVVEEFDSDAFRAALRQTVAKWHPGIVQLEFTQMAFSGRRSAGLSIWSSKRVMCHPVRRALVQSIS